MWRIRSRFSASVRPRPVAVIPSATNMTVNERQNSSDGISTRLFLRPAWMSANDTPEIADR
jgi:hypothetical protein